ncbi:MAG: hypothetical protein AB7S98_22050, partial [Burkholderiaceae bacterium]
IRTLLVSAGLLAFSGAALSAVIDFEGSTTTGASRILDSDGANAHGPSLIDYAGYDWLGMAVSIPTISVNRPRQIVGIDGDGPITTPVDAGFHRSAVSGSTVAYTQAFSGATSLFASIKARPGSDNFSFLSAYLTSGYRADLNVAVAGLRDGAVVYSQQLVVGVDGPTQFQFDFVDIDEIRFTTSGGSFLYPNGSGVGSFVNPSNAFSAPVLVFDDIDIGAVVATVPVPATSSIMALGLLGLGALRARRSSRSED